MKLVRRQKPPRPRGERRLKAVAVLPSLCTLGNLVCGFGAIYMCILSTAAQGSDLQKPTLDSRFLENLFPTYVVIGAYLILLAMVFDALDGRLARLARKTSDFGAQLDSLCDIVSFGVAPALLILCVVRHPAWGLDVEGAAKIWWRAEWVMLAVYACCAAVRLARFNVENVADESAHRYFRGLPSPGAAAAVISLVILHEEFIRGEYAERLSSLMHALAPTLTLLIGLLMVSRFRYPHMVNTMLRGRRSLAYVLMIVGIVGVGMIKPQATFFVLAFGYALLGPLAALRNRMSGQVPAPAGGEADATRSASPSLTERAG